MAASILIVDDDSDVATLLGQLLSLEGYEVVLAHDGKDGLVKLEQKLPDLILLDVEMPILTGPQMAYELLILDSGREKIPIILLSGVADIRSAAICIGTPYYLTKPYAIDALLSLIQKALKECKYPQRPDFAALNTLASQGPQQNDR